MPRQSHPRRGMTVSSTSINDMDILGIHRRSITRSYRVRINSSSLLNTRRPNPKPFLKHHARRRLSLELPRHGTRPSTIPLRPAGSPRRGQADRARNSAGQGQGEVQKFMSTILCF